MATSIVGEASSFTVRAHRWSAIDTDVEERIERELQRPLSWRQALLHWLIEYNKY
jgi:hypothetical protein